MFRTMRRFKQQLSDEEAKRILKEGRTLVLAVHGDDGYPYAVPLNYVYHDGKVYVHCAKSGHKLDAMKADPKVSFTVIERDDVVPEKLATYYRSVIAFGRARILEDADEKRRAAEVLGLHYYNVPEAVQKEIESTWNALVCIEITIDHLTGKEARDLAMMRKGNAT